MVTALQMWLEGDEVAVPDEVYAKIDEVCRRLQDISEQVKHGVETKELAETNEECIQALSDKLDLITAHVRTHDEATAELLDNFRFQKKLHKWLIGATAVLGALGSFIAASHHLIFEFLQYLADKAIGPP